MRGLLEKRARRLYFFLCSRMLFTVLWRSGLSYVSLQVTYFMKGMRPPSDFSEQKLVIGKSSPIKSYRPRGENCLYEPQSSSSNLIK